MTFRFLLTVATCLFVAGFILSVAAFKIVDSDFWWHLKAGQMMVESGHLITTDPFAYTREGLPYLARHEWLSQVLFALVYEDGGATGIIVLRMLCALGMLALLLSIDRKRLWPNALLVMLAAIVLRQGFIERPQLFTNLFFATFLFVGFRLLDGKPLTVWLIALLLFLEVLWVNMHGAAALLGIVVIGAVWFQTLFTFDRGRTKRLSLLLGALVLALFISPNHYHNVTYLTLLFTDQTAQFIREWAPHPWSQYLSQFWIFWILPLLALWFGGRNVIAVLGLLLAFGILSRLGSRHEALFVLTALGCTFYELKWSERWQQVLDRLERRSLVATGMTVALVLVILWVDAPYRAFLQRNDAAGFGSFAPAEGAFDFVENNQITGPMFNTYGVGGYLLYRGAPERKVFLDGRNVDYGYDFLSKALAARYDQTVFRSLVEEYQFTYAIIEFASTKEEGEPFDFSFLDTDPLWVLVYMDDWSSVYVKRIPQNQPLIDAYGYQILTPEGLDRGTVLDSVTAGSIEQIEAELQRAVAADDRGISAFLVLAKLYRSVGAFDASQMLLDHAIARAPARYEPYEIRASILAAQGKYAEAGGTYEKVLELTRYLPVHPNYAQLVDVFEKAGDIKKAEKYRRKAGS